MNNLLMGSLAVLGGVIASTLYFWGLWLTLNGMTKMNQPALLGVASLAVRLVLMALCLLALFRWGWEGVISFLSAFLFTRFAWIQTVRKRNWTGG